MSEEIPDAILDVAQVLINGWVGELRDGKILYADDILAHIGVIDRPYSLAEQRDELAVLLTVALQRLAAIPE